VGKAGCHFAHRGQAREVRQPLLELAGLVLGVPPLGDVVDRANVLHQSTVGVVHGLCNVVQVLERAVGEHNAVLDVERCGFVVHPLESSRHALAVRRVHPAGKELWTAYALARALRDSEDAVQLRGEVVRRIPLRVHHVIAEVREFLRQPQLGLAPSQLFLGVLALGDVADETREARRGTAAQLADGEVAWEEAAVLAQRLDLAADADDPGFACRQIALQVARARCDTARASGRARCGPGSPRPYSRTPAGPRG
jgi:hypothetical protein